MDKMHFVLIIACLAVLAIPGAYAQAQVSVSLDRPVYPVPFGQPDGTSDFFFPVHATAIGNADVATDGLHLEGGNLFVHIRIDDPSYDLSSTGRDTIANNTERAGDEVDDHGPVKILISRGSEQMVLATAGGTSASSGMITTGSTVKENTIELGPITEMSPDSGVFELDLTIAYTDGPASSSCPTSDTSSVSHIEGAETTHCILKGDTLTVEYSYPADASGDASTVTDSAVFDLRDGSLQADKDTYVIGSDMVLTLTDPDLDLDNDGAETYDLDLIGWDSDAATVSMGDLGGGLAFDPEPSNFRETGDSTGIFQVAIEVPELLDGGNLERGEQIILEYTDWGPSGAGYVGEKHKDINLTVFTSNFGATVELDQEVYTWTDKVYITIVAHDHNFDSDLVDEIGETADDAISITTRDADINNYKLVETGADTGVFSGEVILAGFEHDADGDGTPDAPTQPTSADGTGPTDGFITVEDDVDGITVSFKFSDDETAIDSALIRWNVGTIQWLEENYPVSGTGVVRVVDSDLNLNPESMDEFVVDVVSDSDAGGIALTVTETGEATGMFEGTVSFTNSSSGHMLNVTEGDTVTANYVDHTLPTPNSAADDLDIRATTIIGNLMNNTITELPDDQNTNATVVQQSTSGSAIILNKENYTWTDRVKITVTAPDSNSTTAGEILVNVSTGKGNITDYKLTESGANTGNFTGAITLVGFEYDADGDKDTIDAPTRNDAPGGTGPTGGYLQANRADTIYVSFTNNGNNITASAPIGWTLGTVKWLDADYTVFGSGIFEIVDPDMNLKPDTVDEFKVKFDASSNSYFRELNAKETGESTGVFQVIVPFTLDNGTTTSKLTVESNATIIGKYQDHTLPVSERANQKTITDTRSIAVFTEKNSTDTETNSTDTKPEEKKPAEPKTTKPADKPAKPAEPKQKAAEPKKTTPEPQNEPEPVAPVAAAPIPTPVVPEPDPEPGVDPEPGFDLTADPVCGPGTELVGGACRAIEVQSEGFDILDWLFSLFQR